MLDEPCSWEAEFDEGGLGFFDGSADCHYYNPFNDWSGDDTAEHGLERREGEDWGDFYERWCEEALDSMGTMAPLHAHPIAESTHVRWPAADTTPSLAAHTARRERARAVGKPPRREQFSDATSFRSARAGWFERYTGYPLAAVGIEAQQRRAWDNVTRAWRAYTDGRYSLGVPIWDGHVSRRDWRRQDGNAVAIDLLCAASQYV